MSLSEKIKNYCSDNGISYREFAEKVGVTEVTMSRIVRNSYFPKPPILLNISRILDIPIDEIIYEETCFDKTDEINGQTDTCNSLYPDDIEEKDNVNHPKHYEASCSLECIDVMLVTFGEKAVYDFCLCNAFKYLWRFKNKNGEEDIKKAEWYLNKAEELLSESEFGYERGPKELIKLFNKYSGRNHIDAD